MTNETVPLPAAARAPLLLLTTAFLATYVFWGATFLAIRVLVVEHPPFTLAGARFLLAGGLLYAWGRIRGAGRPTVGDWEHAALAGTFLFFLTYGAVFWTSQYLPSGLVALLAATIPLWVVALDMFRPGSARPGPLTWIGLAAGVAGVAIIARPEPDQLRHVPLVPVLVALGGALAWALGTTVLLRRKKRGTALLATGQQMLWGGLLLTLVGLAAGERPDAHAWLAWKPWIAFGYLVVCGSLLAFLAYNWLLRTVTPAQASSYAFANPVIAVILGWLVLDEPLTWMFALGGALVVIAVALVHGGQRPRREGPREKEGAGEGVVVG